MNLDNFKVKVRQFEKARDVASWNALVNTDSDIFANENKGIYMCASCVGDAG
jgi:hypothetical protein